MCKFDWDRRKKSLFVHVLGALCACEEAQTWNVRRKFSPTYPCNSPSSSPPPSPLAVPSPNSHYPNEGMKVLHTRAYFLSEHSGRNRRFQGSNKSYVWPNWLARQLHRRWDDGIWISNDDILLISFLITRPTSCSDSDLLIDIEIYLLSLKWRCSFRMKPIISLWFPRHHRMRYWAVRPSINRSLLIDEQKFMLADGLDPIYCSCP